MIASNNYRPDKKILIYENDVNKTTTGGMKKTLKTNHFLQIIEKKPADV